MTWLFMVVAIWLALLFLGAEVITRLIGCCFDHMVELVKQTRNEGQDKEEKL